MYFMWRSEVAMNVWTLSHPLSMTASISFVTDLARLMTLAFSPRSLICLKVCFSISLEPAKPASM